MSTVLITGGAGFVGRHFCKYFLEQQYDVTVVDDLVKYTGGLAPSKWPLFNPYDYNNFNFVKMDCRDWFKSNPHKNFDYSFHLAAMVCGREMIENNPLAIAEDLSIDSMYWKWAETARPKKTICFSSSAAYPIELQREGNFRLLKEADISFNNRIGIPDLSYGWAKLTHEYLAKLAYEKHGLKSVTYRPFSGYGEDQDMAYPFPSICQRVIDNKGSNKINVWGTGKQMRDFIHISDCVTGVIRTMDKIENGNALNLSTGIYTSFIEFASIATDLLGYNPIVEGLSQKPSGVFARGGDTTLQNKFGFKCSISIEQGIKQTLEFLEAKK